MTSLGIWVCSAFAPPIVCIPLVLVFLSQTQNPMVGDIHTASSLGTSGAKRENIFIFDLRYDATSQLLCSHRMG